ncbi:MAG: hypothetical protein FJY19_07685 [Bacteroidetes bacterium]|nr:hypothetical protein [Bacteroidota bacterium]
MSSQLQSPVKITPEHLARRAVVYVRQSSDQQVRHNLESQRLQYALADRARGLGWTSIDTIDADLGISAGVGTVRPGFDRLLASVARGEVGIVLAREVSRLSRNDKDFCRLVELCQAFGTLLGDGDTVYDPGLLDDQLILGIKGTLSVIELRTLRLRLIQGMQSKAKRGQFQRNLPPGFVWDPEGQVALDPNERVRHAITYIFEVYGQTASVRQTMIRLQQEGFEVPVRTRTGPRDQVVWQLPRGSFVGSLLHNPCYAGAYVWGRNPLEHRYVDGRLVHRQGKRRTLDACAVTIWDHHPGYITRQQYEEHVRMMADNSTRDGQGSPLRTGHALAAGLLRCARCGRHLKVQQWTNDRKAGRYVCDGTYVSGGHYCIATSGRSVDSTVAAEMVRVLSPLGLEASLAALAGVQRDRQGQRDGLALQVRQLQYEAQVAQERYEHVDARNRLVAADLEGRWNAKLEELQAARGKLTQVDAETTAVAGDDERETIRWLGQRFGQVWNHPACPADVKKRLVRAVIREIVVDITDTEISLLFHWQGGCHTRVVAPRLTRRTAQRNSPDDLATIGKLAPRYTDDQIALVLSQQGSRTGKGGRWTRQAVRSARTRAGIAGGNTGRPDPALLSMADAARFANVSDTTIRRLVNAGLLTNQQSVAWAPWEIPRTDFAGEAVTRVIDHLHRTGRLVLDPRRLESRGPELPLFQGDNNE